MRTQSWLLVIGTVALSMCARHVVGDVALRQTFPFGGDTTVTDGTLGFPSSRTPTSSLNASVGVVFTAPSAGYISRIEFRLNGFIQQANFGVFEPFVALHSSVTHAGIESDQGDLGSWSDTVFSLPLFPAGTSGGEPQPPDGLQHWETFIDFEAGILPLDADQLACLCIGFYRNTVDSEDGLILIAETNAQGTFSDFVTGRSSFFGPDGWVYTREYSPSVRFYDGQLAVNVYFRPTSVCRADVNRDGAVNSQDLFDFLAAFFAFEPAADFNDDALINSQDFFEFLTSFFEPC